MILFLSARLCTYQVIAKLKWTQGDDEHKKDQIGGDLGLCRLARHDGECDGFMDEGEYEEEEQRSAQLE